MRQLRLCPLGPFDERVLEELGAWLGRALNVPVEAVPARIDLEGVFDSRRQQHRSDLLLDQLQRQLPGPGGILGVTAVDLFIPVLTFVFGEAQFGGQAAVVSTFRLRNELLGMNPDPGLLQDRLQKESLHELGHVMGLVHCYRADCVMQPSTYMEMVDLKPAEYCGACRLQLNGESARAVPRPRY